MLIEYKKKKIESKHFNRMNKKRRKSAGFHMVQLFSTVNSVRVQTMYLPIITIKQLYAWWALIEFETPPIVKSFKLHWNMDFPNSMSLHIRCCCWSRWCDTIFAIDFVWIKLIASYSSKVRAHKHLFCCFLLFCFSFFFIFLLLSASS